MKTMKMLMACAALITLSHPVMAEEVVTREYEVKKGGALVFDNAYSYATSPKQQAAAVFLTIKNNTPAPLMITGATAQSVAHEAELHIVEKNGDAMRMKEVPYYTVPANDQLTLDPTGAHIMLMGLSKPLTAGETFTLGMALTDGTVMEAEVVVVAPGTKPGEDAHSNHEAMDHSAMKHDDSDATEHDVTLSTSDSTTDSTPEENKLEDNLIKHGDLNADHDVSTPHAEH